MTSSCSDRLFLEKKEKASVLAETPVTQHSPCYSAVSASLTNPLPNCSNYSPFCNTYYLILRINTSCLHCCSLSMLQRFTAESSRELMSSEDTAMS